MPRVSSDEAVFTRPECAAMLATLVPAAQVEISSRNLWRLEQAGLTLGAAMPGARVRFYTRADVLLLRLYYRLVSEGVRPWVARGAIVNREAELRQALRPNSRMVLAVRGIRAVLEPVGAGRGWAVRVPLADLFDRFEAVASAVLSARSSVWVGHKYEPVSTVATAVVRLYP